jgi:hypothetical protein
MSCYLRPLSLPSPFCLNRRRSLSLSRRPSGWPRTLRSTTMSRRSTRSVKQSCPLPSAIKESSPVLKKGKETEAAVEKRLGGSRPEERAHHSRPSRPRTRPCQLDSQPDQVFPLLPLSVYLDYRYRIWFDGAVRRGADRRAGQGGQHRSGVPPHGSVLPSPNQFSVFLRMYSTESLTLLHDWVPPT